MLAFIVDLRDQLRHCCSFRMSDFLQAAPEWLFKAHAGLMAVDHVGAFDELKISCPPPKKVFVKLFLW